MRAITTWALLAALAASTCASLVRPAPGLRRMTPMSPTTTTVQRLPLEVLPVEYIISVTPYFEPEGDFQQNQFQGRVLIFGTVNDEVSSTTDTITLHAAKTLQFDKDTVRVQYQGEFSPAVDITVTSVDRDDTTEMATIRLVTEISGNVIIYISYTGQLAEDMDGFYVSTYEANGETRYLGATQFETSSAREAFPCFDEPAVKATFTIVINPPEGYGALFNTDPIEDPVLPPTGTDGDVANTAPHSRLLTARSLAPAVEGRTPVYFGMTKPMSTYLVAFLVYHKETFGALVKDATESQGPLRIWSREDFAGQRSYALDVGAASLSAYGRLFPDYFRHMNSKMDQVAIPDFSAGAMENWGLVTYRERGVLIDEAESTTESHSSVVTTIAHELAHQWFGDLVSPDFWNVLWLNEGFATYWSYHVDLGSITEGWQLRDQFLAVEMSAALETDSGADTHPMTTGENTTAPFDDITYSKGGCILRMFSSWIGEDEFYERLNTYLISLNYTSAQPADLFAALAPDDEVLQEHMAFWTSTAGYPVINVSRDNTTVHLKQGKYQLTPSNDDQTDPVWPILVSFNNGSQFWMLENHKDITMHLEDGEPLYLNNKWSGFYRVNYDTAGWRAVQSHLMSDYLVVPRETRAQLVSDAFSLARSDHLDYSLAWELSRYLQKEDDYLPWAVAFRAFDFLDTALAPTGYYSSFKTYMQRLLGDPYAAVRFEVLPDDDHVTRLLRVNVLKHACRFGYPSCQEAASGLATEAFSSEGLEVSSLDPDLRSTAYCEWAQDTDLWGSLWQRYLDTTVATEKVELLSALGCSQDNATLYQYLEYALNATLVRPQDWATAYAGVYSTPFGLQVAMDFIGKNAAALSEQSDVLQTIISRLAGKVVIKDQLDQLKSLSSVEALKAVNATLQSAIATAEEQVSWADTHVPLIGMWLDNEVRPASASTMVRSSTVQLLICAIGSVVFHLLSAGL